MTSYRKLLFAMLAALTIVSAASVDAAETTAGVKVAVFDIDATPPIGSMMAYDRVLRQDDLPLRCRGMVLIGAGEPIVLCALDWIGVANEAQDYFRAALAKAAGTTVNRVVVHTLHQHDAPDCDFLAERLLKEAGATDLERFDGTFARQMMERAAQAVTAAIPSAHAVTHIGWGAADVHDVASNRRIMGPDGKIRITRYTATKDPAVRAEPIGVIDPEVSLVSFWNADRPVAVLSYYACHAQSYYRTGIPNPDFPGIARFVRGQACPEALHIHFNGAGGNIGAGKFNDGAKENRVTLAMRLADGMRRAWETTTKAPVTAEKIQWRTVAVALPLAPQLDEAKYRAALKGASTPTEATLAADKLAWILRCQGGHKVDIALLSVGDIRIVHMPGELFVEYQLAAKAMRPDCHIAMAAYGEYGPAYIGTAKAYEEGGYETGPNASNVAPEVETVLMGALKELLDAK